jgi:DNA-binding response OmpR family regulator
MALARGPKRILVVEDEENISQTLRYNLTREGYEVPTSSCSTSCFPR